MEKNINYEKVKGVGRPLVFVHGWLGSINSWDMVRDKLSIQNPLIFYDQRCHGESFCKDFSIEDLATDLKDLIENLDLQNPIIIGHSLGGMTALNYSVKYSGYHGLILLATSVSTPKPEEKDFDYYIEKLGSISKEKWAEKISQNYAGETKREELRRKSKKELIKKDDKELKRGLKAMKNYDLRPEIKETKLRNTLVVGGKKDGAITLEKVKETRELTEGELKIINSGHLMPWEKPEKLSRIIENFIKEKLE